MNLFNVKKKVFEVLKSVADFEKVLANFLNFLWLMKRKPLILTNKSKMEGFLFVIKIRKSSCSFLKFPLTFEKEDIWF